MQNKDEIILDQYIKGMNTNLKGIETIKKQMEKCICRVIKDGGISGSGFFAKIEKKDTEKIFYIFVTNNHILNEDYISNEDVVIYSFDDGKKLYLKNMEKRKKYTNIINDITIIEILEGDDLKDENFLELEEFEYSKDEKMVTKAILKNKNKEYKGKVVYNLSFPYSKEAIVSFGNIKQFNFNEETGKFTLGHDCDTEKGSSGSPILCLENNKVIAVHFGSLKELKGNLSSLIFPAVNEFLNTNNKLKVVDEVNKNKEEYKSNNSMTIKYKVLKSTYNLKILGNKFYNNNKENCKISVNNQNPVNLKNNILEVNEIMRNKKEVEIKLIETDIIEDMSYMFGRVSDDEDKIPVQEVSINWNTENVKNMSKLFCECNELTSITNLDKINTEKVKDLSFMFFGCEKLENIDDISRWDTKNVENMSNMFAYCKNLKSISYLGKWNVEKVKDLSDMFLECRSLQDLKGLEKWKVKSVENSDNYIDIFFNCSSLKNVPNIDKWGKKNINLI